MQKTISCITVTRCRPELLAHVLQLFLGASDRPGELVIVDDSPHKDSSLMKLDRLRYLKVDSPLSLGAKRNLACQHARGDIILHWDDDDWYAPWRIEYQVSELLKHDADICGLDTLVYYDPRNQRAFRYRYPPGAKPWVAGNTLCYKKSFWEKHPFQDVQVGEDARFVWQADPRRILRLENDRFIVAMIHDSNVSPKRTSGRYWTPVALSEVTDRMGAEREVYDSLFQANTRTALVAASRGIGDILRVTPLIRVLHQLGYRVDVLLQPDFEETATLLEGALEIRRIVREPRECDRENYDVAVFTYWSASQRAHVHSRQQFSFNREEWLERGDSHSVERIARELGWKEAMPAPFAIASTRRFDLPPDTVVLHPGCKADWPWKKWHGFDELAKLLPNAAVIGTPSDLENQRTYFQRPFVWPSHVRNYVGQLSLSDTAALISQCSALVSNDSGLMHLGAALGVPTLGVFGITNPAREAMQLPIMHPVTKRLACEAACRRQPWGRSDCELHLRCLKTLTAAEVRDRLEELLSVRPVSRAPAQSKSTIEKKIGKESNEVQKLGLAYHGHVFDASGYGNAARNYIHALHAAGVQLSVHDLSRGAPQVHDELVESLIDRPIHADFHLFHGIPSVWARDAFRLPNAIGMTVWETDTMPPQWRNTLNHVLQVWLPCDFNITAFRCEIRRSLFKLPHPVVYRNGTRPLDSPGDFLRVAPGEFVVYSIFEWQERKGPVEQIKAYLSAFSRDDNTALILKTNGAACEPARQAIQAARESTGSDARVELRCENWDDAQVATLHSRGDCYLSLHRGEGWGYPLFEAVCEGKPVVATAYSGPLEYLDERRHHLVRYRLGPVQQQYRFYHSGMRWAEPDWQHAAECLRAVYRDRETSRALAAQAASEIKARYSLETVGELARDRLLDLLQRTDARRFQQVALLDRAERFRPPVPIPATWFDADYFDNGLKSNWTGGYAWEHFRGLFHDTAAFLSRMFPNAHSYLDAGCAKGFLVRSLRAAGKEAWGFDVSSYAIEAAAEARQWLSVSSAEEYTPGRAYDLVVALHLLSQLSDDQARRFLQRIRPHTRTALFAVIPLGEQDDCPPAPTGDLGHINLRTRDWWHKLFLDCGWRQDPLHSAFEQACQHHDLPQRIGWQIFVYAP
jgi:ADP-heptose:LPS heptosyltransferase/glycosyltransferase involved in cell wall biosynthesis